MDKDETQINKFALDIDVKKSVATSLINSERNISYTEFLNYLPVLRFTNFYKVCINQYGMSSPQYKKTQSLTKPQQSVQYFDFLSQKIALLGVQPYKFIFGKRVYNVDKIKLPLWQHTQQMKSISTESLKCEKSSEQEVEILVNRAIHDYIKQSLLNVFKFYDKPTIEQFQKKYFSLIEKQNEYEREGSQQDYQQLLHHFLTINILLQIMKQLVSAFNDLKNYFEALAKPGQSHYAIEVAKILTAYTNRYPRIDYIQRVNQALSLISEQKQARMNSYNFKQRQRYDRYKTNEIICKVGNAERCCGNWEGKEQQKYYKDIINKKSKVFNRQ